MIKKLFVIDEVSNEILEKNKEKGISYSDSIRQGLLALGELELLKKNNLSLMSGNAVFWNRTKVIAIQKKMGFNDEQHTINTLISATYRNVVEQAPYEDVVRQVD